MKVKAFIFYAAALLAIATVFAWIMLNMVNRPEPGKEQLFDPLIVARVNGIDIRAEEVNYFLNLRDQAEAENQAELRQKQRAALDELINRLVYRQEAERRELQVTEQELDQRIKLDYERIGEERFLEILAARNIPLEDYREEMRSGLLVEKLISSVREEIERDINVTEDEIKQYYEDNKDALFTSAQIAHIYIRIRGDGEEALNSAMEKAEKVIAELNEGADFAELAKTYSDDQETKNDGGLLGDINDPSISEVLRYEAIQLDPGQHSQEPIRQHSALHVIKCLNKSAIPLDEVREQIRREVSIPLIQAGIESVFSALRAQADIKIYLK